MAVAGLVLAAVLLQGCSSKCNTRATNSHFVFPNSNVEMLGPARAKVVRYGVLLPPRLKHRHVVRLIDDARRQVAGSDLLMNFTTETVFTSFVILPVYRISLTIDGTAAKMTIGNQELIENADY